MKDKKKIKLMQKVLIDVRDGLESRDHINFPDWAKRKLKQIDKTLEEVNANE